MIVCLATIACKNTLPETNWQAKYDLLSGSYTAIKKENETLNQEKKDLQKKFDELNIDYKADELFIGTLESRVLKMQAWISIAEEILAANGIDFVYIDDKPFVDN